MFANLDGNDPSAIFNILTQNELVQLRQYLFPDGFNYRSPINSKGLSDPRNRSQLKEARCRRNQPKEEIIDALCKYNFSASQTKLLIVLYQLMKVLGSPSKKLEMVVRNWNVPYRKLRIAKYIRYYYLGNLHKKPSRVLFNLYTLSDHQQNISETLSVEKSPTPHIFEHFLEKIEIPNTLNSLPSYCKNYRRYFFINELFLDNQINTLVQEIEAYPKGKKNEKAEQIVFHTNVALTDLVKKLDIQLEEYRNYFIMLYDLDNNAYDYPIKEFRERLIEKMRERGETRHEELWADPDFWGDQLTAEDGDRCDSTWEVQIDNFLDNHEIPHFKPKSANLEKYYENTWMYPDWVIDGKMIELFGATYIEGYEEKMEYKKSHFQMPLISISKEDYEDRNERWKKIIRRNFSNYF